MKPDLHRFLHVVVPLALAVCFAGFLVTVALAPLSKLFILIAIGVGLVASLITMEELTGGTKLSWLSIPIVIVGDIFDYAVTFGSTDWIKGWVYLLQFVFLVFFTESVVILLMRSRMERFVRRKGLRS